MLDEPTRLAARRDPGRELKMHGAQLASRVQRLQRLEEPTPQLFLKLFRNVAVVDVLAERQPERFLDVLGKDPRLG